jgi:hypothetical protein
VVKHTIRANNEKTEVVKQGLEFYLASNADGEVVLYADDDGGAAWQILKIAANGGLSLAECISDNLGLLVADDNGEIEINEDNF